jgi:hypothetical protein
VNSEELEAAARDLESWLDEDRKRYRALLATGRSS